MVTIRYITTEEYFQNLLLIQWIHLSWLEYCASFMHSSPNPLFVVYMNTKNQNIKLNFIKALLVWMFIKLIKDILYLYQSSVEKIVY